MSDELVRPGEVLVIAEADYKYGTGSVTLRITHVGPVIDTDDGKWLALTGRQRLFRGREEPTERTILVRVSALAKSRR